MGELLTAEYSVAGERFGWESIGDDRNAQQSWAHPGAALTATGETVVTDAAATALVRYRGGEVTGQIAIDVVECHGLAAVDDGSVWIADTGEKLSWKHSWHKRRGPGRVLRLSPAGEPLAELLAPAVMPWKPTGVAVADFSRACDGMVVVADGYGSEVVHCFDRGGRLRWSRTGDEHGKRFQTPHGICVDDRGSEPRIVVADRGNARLVELSIDGDFLREYGVGVVSSPSGLLVRGDLLWVSELFGSLRIFNLDGELVSTIGEDAELGGVWPNAACGDEIVAPNVADGHFRSPHGIALDHEGGVIVAEWVLGGRVSRLRPLA